MGGGPGVTARLDEQSASDVSRRRFLAGSVLAVGASASLTNGSTYARFDSSVASIGNLLRIDDDPTLNYDITDESQHNNAEYQITYQVEWVADFDRLELEVENLDDTNISGDSYSLSSQDGVVEYPSGGGNDGGAGGDTYRFTFEVYDSSNNVVINEVAEDDADGSGQGEGDFGNSDSTNLDSITVVDETQWNTGNYTVEYELSNIQNKCQDVLVTFANQSNSWADDSGTGPCDPTGSVSYSQGGVEDDVYEITVEVRDTNGLTVDSHTITDTADGDNTSWTA